MWWMLSGIVSLTAIHLLYIKKKKGLKYQEKRVQEMNQTVNKQPKYSLHRLYTVKEKEKIDKGDDSNRMKNCFTRQYGDGRDARKRE